MLFEVGHEAEHGSSLGMKYLINDAGYVTSAAHDPVHHHHHAIRPHATSLVPAPTLVYAPGGDLEIRLLWDASVARAPSGFTRAIIAAAELYVGEFAGSLRAVGTELINIGVGYGEVGGSPMQANALGESESYGYLTDYATITPALQGGGISVHGVERAEDKPVFRYQRRGKGARAGCRGFRRV
jgi:hypothetical protein